MEDLQMFKKLSIKSSIKDYEVEFCEDITSVLSRTIQKGDFIIIDRQIADKQELRSFIVGSQHVIIIDANENAKSYEGLIPVIDKLILGGFKKNNTLIAIGGGVTQDITSFIASILYRGVGWIFFPTTLLAQADSCIGSKTSINFSSFKNQLGNFYPPLRIFIYTKFLDSLIERDIRSGIGEMAHYFFVSGDSDVDYFEKEYAIAINDRSNLKKLIAASLSIKKRYIEKDEFDQRERIVFNYGHTFGHAIEGITNYGIPHGVAVSFGMDMANYISYKKGYISKEYLQRARKIFRDICHGYSIIDIRLQDLINAMGKDKKNKNGKLGLILTKGWGNMFRDFTEPDEVFLIWMQEYFDNFEI
jgi:3-dehydroquinate synthase